MHVRSAITALVISSFLCSPLLAQQRHVVSPAQMRQALAEQARAEQLDRAAVIGLLKQPQVREVANRLGLSVADAETAVAALSGEELGSLAATARQADRELSGGSTIVISTTTLLLVIIIIILLAK